MENADQNTASRLEGMALGQYLAVRSILLAIISTVTLALTAVTGGLILGLSATIDWPENPEELVVIVWIAGAILSVVFLVRSISVYFEHVTVNRELEALQSYSSWADAIGSETPGGVAPEPRGKGTSDISRDWSERATIARDPSIPIDLLERLAGDSMPAVRNAVAENPSVPKRIIDELAKDRDPGVKGTARRRRMEM